MRAAVILPGNCQSRWLPTRLLQVKVRKISRCGVQDTRFEAKNTKKCRGQGQGQTLSRPRTKDTGVSVLKKRSSKFFFRRFQKKQVFKIFFQAIPEKTGLQNFFSGDSRKNRSSKFFFRRNKFFKKLFSGDLHLRKTKKVFENFLRGFWRFPTKFQRFKK